MLIPFSAELYSLEIFFNLRMLSLICISTWQVENAEVRKRKYGNGNTEVKRKAA